MASSSHGSKAYERHAARDQILGAQSSLNNLFQNAQTNQLGAIDSAFIGAQANAETQASTRSAGQGLGASNIGGPSAYVLQQLLPAMMQQRSAIYGQTAQNQGNSQLQLLQLLNQNAGLSASSQGGFGSTGIAQGVGAAAACWVAEELYGADDIKTIAARRYCKTHDNWFTRLYSKYGVAWAAWLKAHSWAKPIVEPIWYWMAKTALEEYRQRKAV